jgi:hypothetical protein
MPHRLFFSQLSPIEIEMKELGLVPGSSRVCPTLLLSLALTNVVATTLTLLAQ